MLSLTRSELRITLVVAAVLWFMTIISEDLYLTLILTWGAWIYIKRWRAAHPGEGIFDEPEKEKPVAKAVEPKPEAPAAEEQAAA